MSRTESAALSVNALIESHDALLAHLRDVLILIARHINPAIGPKPTTEEWVKLVTSSKRVISNARGGLDEQEEQDRRNLQGVDGERLGE
jgi:hypothetical protein